MAGQRPASERGRSDAPARSRQTAWGRGEGTPGNLCASKQKARLTLAGQNGRRNQGNTVIQTPTCKKTKAKRHKRHHKRGGHR